MYLVFISPHIVTNICVCMKNVMQNEKILMLLQHFLLIYLCLVCALDEIEGWSNNLLFNVSTGFTISVIVLTLWLTVKHFKRSHVNRVMF